MSQIRCVYKLLNFLNFNLNNNKLKKKLFAYLKKLSYENSQITYENISKEKQFFL